MAQNSRRGDCAKITFKVPPGSFRALEGGGGAETSGLPSQVSLVCRLLTFDGKGGFYKRASLPLSRRGRYLHEPERAPYRVSEVDFWREIVGLFAF